MRSTKSNNVDKYCNNEDPKCSQRITRYIPRNFLIHTSLSNQFIESAKLDYIKLHHLFLKKKKKKNNKEIYTPYDKKEHLQVFSNGEFQIDHSKRRNDREGLLGRNPGKYNHHPAHRN